MPLYKSSKSEKLIEIDSAFDESGKDRNRDEAIAKGWVPVHKMVSKSGKTINVTDDALPEAMQKGWETEQVAKAKKAPIGISKTESAIRGAAQSMTLGAADELSSALTAPFSDKTYGELVSDYRKVDKAAFDENPVSMIAGGVVAGLPIGGGAASSLGQLAKQGATLGGITGWNSGEGLKDRAVQALAGGTIGAAAPYALKGVGKVAEKAGDKAVDSYQYLKGAMGEGRRVSSQSNSGALLKPIDFAEGAISAIKQGRGLKGELDELRTAIGSGKQLGTPGADDPIIGLDLLEAGPSPAKQFVATKAASAGGNDDADLYRKVLEMGVDRRLKAREFSNKAAAKELAPTVAQLQDEFQKARDEGFNALQQRARQSFKPEADDINNIFNTGGKLVNKREVQPTVRFREDALFDDEIEAAAQGYKVKDKELSIIPAKNQAEVELALDIIQNGEKNVGGLGQRFSEDPWDEIPADELFDRLQFARQKLDEQIDYFSANKMQIAEREVAKVRNQIDQALKKASGKIEADELFSRGKSIDGKLFGATEFRAKDGRTDVDEFKLAKLFNDNDSAGRFGNTLDEAEEFLSNPNFNQDTASRLRDLLTKLKETRNLAQDKRTIEAFRQKPGPSSPAIQLQSYLANRAKLPSEAIGAPTGFVNSVDQFMRDFAVRGYGKPFAELPSEQKSKLLKLYLWNKNNPKATQKELQAAANNILGAP